MSKKKRRSYDLPIELINKINEIAEELEIPQGHLVAFFAMKGIQGLESGELSLEEYLEPHLNSLKYRFSINLGDELSQFRGSDDE